MREREEEKRGSRWGLETGRRLGRRGSAIRWKSVEEKKGWKDV